eukprot:TRINITY_DN4380_c0_g1_i1.p1 TRINITY_DN4380_c0_g1~~TRINITY_DN4380_c0_g1_i1.p1  ORF type:complete len:469 (+),score=30.77 TRINITY_DN4380_c0_g1_i1:40-1407(+)
MAVNSDGDERELPLEEGSTPEVRGDVLLENARRFAKRMVGKGFSKILTTPSGKKVKRVVGLGNPLLDVSDVITDEFLEKYNLTRNGACVAEPSHEPVFEYLKNSKTAVKIPGGSCLNTLRVSQWLNQIETACTYLGTVGCDDYGSVIRQESQADGLLFPYLAHPTLPTGSCAVLVADKDRTLIANLGASVHFDHRTLEDNKEVADAIVASDILYCEGFVFNASPQAIFNLALHAFTEKKTFVLNLSAAFVPGLHKHHWERILPYTNHLFGNSEEAQAYADAMEWEINDGDIAVAPRCVLEAQDRKLASIALRLSSSHIADPLNPRTVVITQGARPTILATRGVIKTFATPMITDSEIVDTNGSGDAFVGGYLAMLAHGAGSQECVRYGQRAAREMLKTSGCTLPSSQDSDLIKELASGDHVNATPQSPNRSRALSISASVHIAMETSCSSRFGSR